MGGGLFGVGVRSLSGIDAVLFLALGNVIIGLLLLLPIVADEHARRLFFKGPRPGESSDLRVGLLWLFPTLGLSVGLIWWLLGRFL